MANLMDVILNKALQQNLAEAGDPNCAEITPSNGTPEGPSDAMAAYGHAEDEAQNLEKTDGDAEVLTQSKKYSDASNNMRDKPFISPVVEGMIQRSVACGLGAKNLRDHKKRCC